VKGRKPIAILILIIGHVVALLGFLLAAFSGMVGAPLIFVIGVVLIFISPVVYELYPGKED
jgi:hypothetical protein